MTKVRHYAVNCNDVWRLCPDDPLKLFLKNKTGLQPVNLAYHLKILSLNTACLCRKYLVKFYLEVNNSLSFKTLCM